MDVLLLVLHIDRFGPYVGKDAIEEAKKVECLDEKIIGQYLSPDRTGAPHGSIESPLT